MMKYVHFVYLKFISHKRISAAYAQMTLLVATLGW